MKNKLTNLTEVLAYQLEGMYDTEKKLQHSIPICVEVIKLEILKLEVKKYGELATDKRTKLKRIFSYLLIERFGRKNKVIDSLLKDTQEMIKYASTDHLRDAVVLACMESINHYKIANYNTALAFAIELNLETVSDLLHEILAWEKETATVLTKIAFEELNKKESPVLPS